MIDQKAMVMDAFGATKDYYDALNGVDSEFNQSSEYPCLDIAQANEAAEHEPVWSEDVRAAKQAWKDAQIGYLLTRFASQHSVLDEAYYEKREEYRA